MTGSASGFGALARWDLAGGGGGTDSPLDPTLGVPDPTSSNGALFDSSSGAFAAFAVDLSTLPKIVVIPSLTFFPAALPIALPAAEAPTSVIVCAPTIAATNGMINKIRRIQYLIWQRNIASRRENTGEIPYPVEKNTYAPP